MGSPVRIGINPLTWSNDDMPGLGGDTSLETCLREAKQAGYAGMELGNKFPRTPEKLQAVMKPYGLDVVSGWYSSNLLGRSVEAEIDALEAHLHLLQATGCNVLVFCETTGSVQGDMLAPLSRRPKMDDAQWLRLIEGVNRVAEHTAKRGVRLAYHHHMGTVVQTTEEIDRLMAAVSPHVWLLLDTGHVTYAGGDPVELAKKHGARVAHVHTKDVRGPVMADAVKGEWSFLSSVLAGVFTVPGDGNVDFAGVFRALKEHGYYGWVVVEAEQDPMKAHPLTYAKMGYANVSKLLREAGLLT
jgi:inosose dehydratase